MNTKHFLLLLVIIATNIYSQNNYNFSQFGSETKNFIKQPFNWSGDDWLKTGLIGAGVLLTMQADQIIRDEMMKDRSYYNSAPIKIGKWYGDLASPLIFIGSFGLHGLLADNQSSKKIAFELTQTVLYAGAITTFLKAATGRSRPYMNEGTNSFFNGKIFDNSFLSFPSGHTTIAFSISTVISKNAKQDWLKIAAYIPAVLTGVSRVYQDNHWTSDVVLGAAIGYFVGSWVVDQHEGINFNSTSPGLISISIKL